MEFNFSSTMNMDDHGREKVLPRIMPVNASLTGKNLAVPAASHRD
jgi:hypothetical protein